jgi:hypothetical protein
MVLVSFAPQDCRCTFATSTSTYLAAITLLGGTAFRISVHP